MSLPSTAPAGKSSGHGAGSNLGARTGAGWAVGVGVGVGSGVPVGAGWAAVGEGTDVLCSELSGTCVGSALHAMMLHSSAQSSGMDQVLVFITNSSHYLRTNLDDSVRDPGVPCHKKTPKRDFRR
jgi:hypothetical protein